MTDQFSKDNTHQRVYAAFADLLSRQDNSFDLAQAALLIACVEYPHLDIPRYIEWLDRLACRVRATLALPGPDLLPQLPPEVETLSALDAMNRVLFAEEHFHGNSEDYYNPNNSFLNKVLEERTGIPITLSLLYMEVGRRVGLHIAGLGFPAHFIVQCALPQGMIYIDPYADGLLMSEQDCLVRMRQVTRQRIKAHSQWFTPFTHRQWLVRMLSNLKHIYIEQDNFDNALTICDFLLVLNPQAPGERRDRGLLHLQRKQYSRAIHDLTMYIELAPQADDHAEILDYIKMARQTLAMLN